MALPTLHNWCGEQTKWNHFQICKHRANVSGGAEAVDSPAQSMDVEEPLAEWWSGHMTALGEAVLWI